MKVPWPEHSRAVPFDEAAKSALIAADHVVNRVYEDMETVLKERALPVTHGFDSFVVARGAALHHAAWLLTGDAHLAEDLVQTALSKTYFRYGSFENDRHFEAYLRTTLYRTFVSWWRRRSWRSELPSAAPPDQPNAEIADAAAGQDVRTAIAGLPRVQRAVLVLRYFEDRSTKEVAELLRMPEGTVRSHTSRGLAALRTSPHLVDEGERS